MARVYPESAAMFYEESRASSAEVASIFREYRDNTSKVLALATGATTLFGLSNELDSTMYILALIAYGVAVLAAITIYWPTKWKFNVAEDAEKAFRSDIDGKLTPAQVALDFGAGHQLMADHNANIISRSCGIARRFQLMTFCSGLVVVFGGLAVVIGG